MSRTFGMPTTVTAEKHRAFVDFDRQLTSGQRCEARWTNSNRYYVGYAIVKKVNRASVRVELTEEVPSQIGYEGYPVGREIVLPRYDNKLWSRYNCCAPILDEE